MQFRTALMKKKKWLVVVDDLDGYAVYGWKRGGMTWFGFKKVISV